MLSTIAWIEKFDDLARKEVLRAPEPPLEILDYWPTTTVTVWRGKRQEPAPRFDKRLTEIAADLRHVEIPSSQRLVEVSQRQKAPQTISTKLQQLLRSTGFHSWMCSVHDVSQDLDAACAELKQGEEIEFAATLEDFRSSLLRAIGMAHVGIDGLPTLWLRLRILERRFNNISTFGDDTMDLQTPLSSDFTFLRDLTGLPPSLIAKVLADGCWLLYRNIAYIDVTGETENSKKMSEWFNDLQQKGEECVAAGLANKVQALAKCLWKVGDHHSSIALESSYKPTHKRNYWDRCTAEAHTDGILFSFMDCKRRAEKYKALRNVPGIAAGDALKKEHAFLLDIISKSLKWGDLRHPYLTSFRESPPAPDTSDKENRQHGSSSTSESGDTPRTVKHSRSLRKLGKLFKKIPSDNGS